MEAWFWDYPLGAFMGGTKTLLGGVLLLLLTAMLGIFLGGGLMKPSLLFFGVVLILGINLFSFVGVLINIAILLAGLYYLCGSRGKPECLMIFFLGYTVSTVRAIAMETGLFFPLTFVILGVILLAYGLLRWLWWRREQNMV